MVYFLLAMAYVIDLTFTYDCFTHIILKIMCMHAWAQILQVMYSYMEIIKFMLSRQWEGFP